MEYRRFGDTIVARLDPGEEILTALTDLAAREDVALAEIRGIGALSALTVGIFATAEKRYHEFRYDSFFEITSLMGMITQREGKPWPHAHITAAGESGLVGGHLLRGVIALTGEITLRVLHGRVGRREMPEYGFYRMDFGD